MDIDKLYKTTCSGGKIEENRLFSNLSEIFQLFVGLRVRSKDDCQEIVQETLMVIADKYRHIEFNVSFSAWAYSILKHKIADYYRKKQTTEQRFIRIDNFDKLMGNMQIDSTFVRQIKKCVKYVFKSNPKYIRIYFMNSNLFPILCKI